MMRGLTCVVLAALLSSVVGVAGAQQFVDINPAVGLPGTSGGAWGDYDGDGYADLLLSSSPPSFLNRPAQLFRNNGNLVFTDVSAIVGISPDLEEGKGVAWGDYDNDGFLDAIVASGSAPTSLYDYDGSSFTERGTAAGLNAVQRSGRTVAWCDYDRDNWLDVFICNAMSDVSALFHNNQDGTFTEVTDAAGMVSPALPSAANDCSWADYNNDDYPDLVVSRGSAGEPVRPMLYRNKGDGTFEEVGVQAGIGDVADTLGVAWLDYDNDGWFDLYLASEAHGPDWLFRNNHDGTFADVSSSAGMASDPYKGNSVACADYDNDGYEDIFVGNTEVNEPFLYHNNANGTFTDMAQAAGLGGSHSNLVAIRGDMDQDGKVDLFVGVGEPTSRLFLNIGPTGGWLRVRLLTSAEGDATKTDQPSRDAIGARVEVSLDNDDTFPAGRTMTRLVDGGGGYQGQHEPVAQFGVSSSTVVAVRVRFPDGSVVTHRNVPVNRRIVIKDIPADRTEELFPDVPLDFWAYEEIKGCRDANIVAGYPDGLYHPELAVTRDQMAVYVARALVAPTGEAALEDYVPADPRNFPDAPDTGYGDDGTEPFWAYKHIEYCVENGVVQGYLDGLYHPDEEVNRAQMAVYVARSLVAPTGDAALADYVPTDPRNFPDAPDTGYGDDGTEPYWAYTHIEYCVENGVVQGYLDGLYHPDEVVTRDQMAVYIARAFQLLG